MAEPGNQEFKIHQVDGGITIVGEQMPHVSSAAFAILVPVGAATDPEDQQGCANLLSDMFNKGAGQWSARELSQQFEDIGVHKSISSGIEVSIFSTALLSENLAKCFSLASTVLREPHLPEEELSSVKALALQDLKGLEDEPASKVMTELAGHFYPSPFGRCQLGSEAGIAGVSIESLRNYYQHRYCTSELVIGVAGAFDWEEVVATVEHCFSGWSGTTERLVVGDLPKESRSHHLQRDTSQVQIALAYPSVSFGHEDYYVAKVAVGVLSGGMAGRLFVEVREKRGLVYRVSAMQSAARDRAAVFASAGTTPENSEETLSVMLEQLQSVGEGLTDEELDRAKADLKSRTILRGEMTSVRASALVNDWWNIGRVRTLEEIKQGIDEVTAADIQRHVGEYPVSPITLTTLGPKEVQLPA